MSDINKIHKAVEKLAPMKAESVMQKYHIVQSTINDALTGKDKETARQAKDHLDILTGEIINLSNIETVSEESTGKRAALVEDLDTELGMIATTLGADELMAPIAESKIEEDAKHYFGNVVSDLKDFGLYLDAKTFVSAYMKRPADKRPNAKGIYDSFVCYLGDPADAGKTTKDVVKDSYGDISKALLLYTNGKTVEANAKLDAVRVRIKIAADVEKTAVPEIARLRKAVEEKQSAHLEAVSKMTALYKGGNHSNPRKLNEVLAVFIKSYEDLVVSVKPLVELQEEFASGGDNPKERLRILREIAGDSLKINTAVFEPVIKTRMIPDLTKAMTGGYRTEKIKTSEIRTKPRFTAVPTSMKDYNTWLERTKRSYLLTRGKLYSLTGDKQYKADYETGNKLMMEEVGANTKSVLDAAISSDNSSESQKYKGLLKVDTLETDLQRTVREHMDNALKMFEDVKQTLPTDAYGGIKKNNYLLSYLSSLKAEINVSPINFPKANGKVDLGSLSLRPMMALSGLSRLREESPTLFSAFNDLLDEYMRQSSSQVMEVLAEDRMFMTFGDDMNNLGGELNILYKSLVGLMPKNRDRTWWEATKGLYNPDHDTFVHPKWAESAHEAADKFKRSAAYDRVYQVPRFLDHIEKLKALDNGLSPEYTKQIARMERQIKLVLEARKELLEKVDEIVEGLMEIDADNIGGIGFLIDSCKFTIKLAFAVAATVVCTPAGLGMVSTMAAVATVSTLSYAAADSIVEWRTDAFRPEALFRSWITTFALGVGAGVLAKPLGGLMARYIINPAHIRLAAIDVGTATNRASELWLELWQGIGRRGVERSTARLAERAAAAAAGSEAAEGNLASRLFPELGEEFLQEGLQAIGAVIAPDNQLVGFAFMLLGSVHRTIADIPPHGHVNFDSDVTGSFTEAGLELDYTDGNTEGVFKLLERIGAPPKVVETFRENGVVDLSEGGFKFAIKPTTEPAAVRRMRTKSSFRDAADISGLEFQEGSSSEDGLIVIENGEVHIKDEGVHTYEGNPEVLIEALEGEYFVETTADGDIIATDLNGREIRFVFNNKHVGLEIASLRHNGLEFDADRNPVVKNPNSTMSVLNGLVEMGFEIEESPNGMKVTKEGGPSVEIRMDKQMVEEMVAQLEQGVGVINDIAELAGSDTSALSGLITKLRSMSSPIKQLILISSIDLTVTIGEVLTNMGVNVDAVAANQMSMDLGLGGLEVAKANGFGWGALALLLSGLSAGQVAALGAALIGVGAGVRLAWRKVFPSEATQLLALEKLKQVNAARSSVAQVDQTPARTASDTTAPVSPKSPPVTRPSLSYTPPDASPTDAEIGFRVVLSDSARARFDADYAQLKDSFVGSLFPSVRIGKRVFEDFEDLLYIRHAIMDLESSESYETSKRATLKALLGHKKDILMGTTNEPGLLTSPIMLGVSAEKAVSNPTVINATRMLDAYMVERKLTRPERLWVRTNFEFTALRLRKTKLSDTYRELAELEFKIKLQSALVKSAARVRKRLSGKTPAKMTFEEFADHSIALLDIANFEQLKARRDNLTAKITREKLAMKPKTKGTPKARKALKYGLVTAGLIAGVVAAGSVAWWALKDEEEDAANTRTDTTADQRNEDKVKDDQEISDRTTVGERPDAQNLKIFLRFCKDYLTAVKNAEDVPQRVIDKLKGIEVGGERVISDDVLEKLKLQNWDSDPDVLKVLERFGVNPDQVRPDATQGKAQSEPGKPDYALEVRDEQAKVRVRNLFLKRYLEIKNDPTTGTQDQLLKATEKLASMDMDSELLDRIERKSLTKEDFAKLTKLGVDLSVIVIKTDTIEQGAPAAIDNPSVEEGGSIDANDPNNYDS